MVAWSGSLFLLFSAIFCCTFITYKILSRRNYCIVIFPFGILCCKTFLVFLSLLPCNLHFRDKGDPYCGRLHCLGNLKYKVMLLVSHVDQSTCSHHQLIKTVLLKHTTHYTNPERRPEQQLQVWKDLMRFYPAVKVVPIGHNNGLRQYHLDINI